jgi:uncharacterized membrane-anchored protein
MTAVRGRAASVLLRPMARKVPAVAASFWAVKLLTTGMGEATSDYAVHKIDPVTAVCLGGVAFVAALGLQLSVRRYIPVVYWLAVVMVAVFGTMCADVLHVRFGVAYATSTVMFAVVLAVVFALWYRVEGTLSVHSITTLRRELFYWAAVLSTFALGTAAGDLTAYTFHLGFFSAGLLFAGVIAVPAVAYAAGLANEVLAFWAAYVVTRPLGASFADWMGVPRDLGGLNWGRGTVSLVLTGLIVAFVIALSVRAAGDSDEERARRGARPAVAPVAPPPTHPGHQARQ